MASQSRLIHRLVVGMVLAVPTPLWAQVVHEVMVMDNQFSPPIVRIEEGEWHTAIGGHSRPQTWVDEVVKEILAG